MRVKNKKTGEVYEIDKDEYEILSSEKITWDSVEKVDEIE